MKTARLNFAERQFINRKVPTLIILTIGTLAILGLLLNIFMTLWNGGEYFKQRKILKEQETARSGLQTRLADAEKQLSSKDTPLLAVEALYLKSILDKKEFSWVEFLDRLEQVKPYRAIIEDINPKVLKDRTVFVKIKGLAQPREEVFRFEENIFNSEYFVKPRLVKEEVDKQSNWQAYDLEFIYIPGGKK